MIKVLYIPYYSFLMYFTFHEVIIDKQEESEETEWKIRMSNVGGFLV